MKIKISKKDIIWNYLGYFSNFGINLLLIPFMFYLLNEEEIGLWYVFLSISGLADVFDFGFAAVISRNISFIWSGAREISKEGFSTEKSNNNIDYFLFAKVLKTSKLIYSTISTLVLFLLLTIGTGYISYISSINLDKTEYLYPWFLFVIAVFLNIKFSFWNYVLKGVGAVQYSNKAFILSKLTQLFLTFILLSFGTGLLGMSIAYLVSTLIQRLLSFYFFHNYKSIGIKLQPYRKIKFSKNELTPLMKVLVNTSYKQGIITVAYFTLNKSPVFISSIFLNLATAGMVGFTLQLLSLIAAIGNSLFNTYLPQFTSDRFNDNNKILYKNLTKSLGVSLIFLLSSGIVLTLVGDYIFKLLKMNTSILPSSQSFFLLIAFVLSNNHFLCGTFISSSNKLSMYKPYGISAIVMVILQIVLSAYTNWNVWALILPMIFIQSFYNNWKWPLETANEFKVSLFRMYVDSLKSVWDLIINLMNSMKFSKRMKSLEKS